MQGQPKACSKVIRIIVESPIMVGIGIMVESPLPHSACSLEYIDMESISSSPIKKALIVQAGGLFSPADMAIEFN